MVEIIVGNQCCRCRREGSVGRTEHRTGVPITWKCSVCRNFVCIDCALRLPGSVPPELYEETLCSEECRQRSGAPSDSVARARGLISHHELIELRAIVANWKGCEQVELVGCGDLQDRIARACQALGIFFGIEHVIVETGQMLEKLALKAQEKD